MGRLTLRAGLRSPVFVVLLLGMGALVAAAPRLTFFGFGESERIVRETTQSALRITSLLLALSCGLSRERESGFWALLASRPISPAGLFLGRALGTLTLVLAALLWLSVVHYGTLKLSGAEAPEIGRLWAEAALEGAALVGLTAALGALLTRSAAAIAVIAVFALAHGTHALAFALPRQGALLEAALLGGFYLALGAAIAQAREPGAQDLS